MRLVLLIIIQLFITTVLFSQDRDENKASLNNIYVGLLGDLSALSINYERIVANGTYRFLTAKVGVGNNEESKLCVWGGCGEPIKYTTIPHHITYCDGYRRTFGEIGLGGTLTFADDSGNNRIDYMSYCIIGIRFRPLQTPNPMFRLFIYIPIVHTYDSLALLDADITYLLIGLSFGIAF